MRIISVKCSTKHQKKVFILHPIKNTIMEEYKKSTEGQVMGIIGIVLGVISLIVAFIPCVGVVAFLPGGLAIVFSIISILQASKGNGSKSLGIISLIISGIAVVIAAAWLMLFSGLSFIANETMKDPKKMENIEKEIREVFRDFDDEKTSKTIDSLENKLRNLEGDTLKK
jgi:hypothetical protein